MGHDVSTKTIKELLFANKTTHKNTPIKGRLAFIAQRCQTLDNINRIFIRQLPSLFSDHCHVCDYIDGVLIVHTHSSAVSNQLRYAKPQLIKQLQSQGLAGLKDLNIKVRPQNNVQLRKPPRPNSNVSTQNRHIIRETAASIAAGQDKESQQLADALQNLASVLDQKSNNT